MALTVQKNNYFSDLLNRATQFFSDFFSRFILAPFKSLMTNVTNWFASLNRSFSKPTVQKQSALDALSEHPSEEERSDSEAPVVSEHRMSSGSEATLSDHERAASPMPPASPKAPSVQSEEESLEASVVSEAPPKRKNSFKNTAVMLVTLGLHKKTRSKDSDQPVASTAAAAAGPTV